MLFPHYQSLLAVVWRCCRSLLQSALLALKPPAIPGLQPAGLRCSTLCFCRKLVVVTTAAIPWMTGTAVNPTLRAAFLAHITGNEVRLHSYVSRGGEAPTCHCGSNSRGKHLDVLQVTLLIPWLAPCDQFKVFPDDLIFRKPSQQEECIREWIKKRTGEYWKRDLSFALRAHFASDQS